MSSPILYLGLDGHKDSVTVAVFAAAGSEPLLLENLPYDLHKIRRFLQRLSRNGEQIRACYEASGAGYVLQRQLQQWGYHCDLCAPALTPTRPGNRRKHDKRDAAQLGKWPDESDPWTLCTCGCNRRISAGFTVEAPFLHPATHCAR